MKNVIKYYYTSYYKFFKFWQSDDDAARNAKLMISLIFGFIWIGIFSRLYSTFVSDTPLQLSREHKPIGYLLTVPLIWLVMKKIKTTYPNNIKRELLRGIIVTLTIPASFWVMSFIIG